MCCRGVADAGVKVSTIRCFVVCFLKRQLELCEHLKCTFLFSRSTKVKKPGGTERIAVAFSALLLPGKALSATYVSVLF